METVRISVAGKGQNEYAKEKKEEEKEGEWEGLRADEIEDITDEWKYPTTKTEQEKFLVFQDLWERGFYSTSGFKFGGDYLIYGFDPFVTHSQCLVIVISEDCPIAVMDLISRARIATTTKKYVVIASVNSQNQVNYTTIHWQGI